MQHLVWDNISACIKPRADAVPLTRLTMLAIVVFVTLALGLAIAIVVNRFIFPRKSNVMLPPQVTPSLPILGNALAYKNEPHVFMLNAAKRYGSIFRINLAGLETTIVTSKSGMRQMAMAPESVLSSRQAVSDFGFLYALGHLNVTEGSAFHKYVVKSHYFQGSPLRQAASRYHGMLIALVEDELALAHASSGRSAADATKMVPDFQYFTRRVFLKLSILDFMGDSVFRLYGATGLDLVTEFLLFQDSMEEAIAQATVLPRVLSLPLYLEPAQRRRGAIVQKLSQAIETVWAQEDQGLGVWLGEIRRNNQRLRKRADGNAAESQDHGGSAAYQREFSATEAAELCCGLLFASHKNPSLAATQTLLFMLEQHGRDPKDSVLDLASVEARGKQVGEGSDLDMRVIHNCIHDTLRLTAHVIGSIRKVVDPRGFTVTITDASSVGDVKAVQEGQVVSYTLPCGSYIGESHFVPNWLSAPERDAGTDVSMPVFELDYMRVQRDSAGEFDNDYEFTTFSHGVHKCAGQHLAVMMIKQYIVVVLSKYQLSAAKDIPGISFERATLAQRLGKCEVCLTPR